MKQTKLISSLYFLLGILAFGIIISSFYIPKNKQYDLGPSETFEITVLSKPKASREAFIVTGKPQAGVFIYFIYESPTTARIGYDAWGSGGPISEAFPISLGKPLSIQVKLPGGNPQVVFDNTSQAYVEVSVNNKRILNTWVNWFPVNLPDVYYGYNPIGGSSCSESFSGSIKQGYRVLWGVPYDQMSFPAKLRHTVIHSLAKYILLAREIILTGIFLGLLLYCLRSLRAWYAKLPTQTQHAYRSFILSIIPCLAVFFYYITRGSFRLFDTEVFNNFYDYQAQSLLKGRLDVPYVAIGGEAFVYNHKLFGYFGLTPALLRLPFALLHVTPGTLSRAYMLIYFAVILTTSFNLLRLHFRFLKADAFEPPTWSIVLLILNVGLGSSFLFLGARAYTYHEAILCGACFALLSIYFSYRILYEPSTSRWVLAISSALLSIHARATTGLFAFFFVGVVASYLLWCSVRSKNGVSKIQASPVSSISIKLFFFIIVSCGLGLFSFNCVSYLKFHDFSGFPLRYNVQYTPERLANFGGKEFQLGNFFYDFYQYFSGVTFSLSKHFPYYVPYNEYQSSFWHITPKIDMIEPTLGIPWIMPGLLVSSLLGLLLITVHVPRFRLPVLLLWTAMLPVACILLCAVVISQRCTADFCPFLIVGMVFCLVSLETLAQRTKVALLTTLSVLTLMACIVTSLVCMSFQGGRTLGVTDSDVSRIESLKSRVDSFFGVKK